MHRFFVLLVASIIIFWSCNKETHKELSVAGKWYIDSIQVGTYLYTNNPIFSTIYKNTGENYYYDFGTNNTLTIYYVGSPFTKTYKLVESSIGKSYIDYGYSAVDSIQSISDKKLILKTPQGGASLVYFSN